MGCGIDSPLALFRTHPTFGVVEEVLSKRAQSRRHAPTSPTSRPHTLTQEAWHGVQRGDVTRHDVCRVCAVSGFQRVADTRCVSSKAPVSCDRSAGTWCLRIPARVRW